MRYVSLLHGCVFTLTLVSSTSSSIPTSTIWNIHSVRGGWTQKTCNSRSNQIYKWINTNTSALGFKCRRYTAPSHLDDIDDRERTYSNDKRCLSMGRGRGYNRQQCNHTRAQTTTHCHLQVGRCIFLHTSKVKMHTSRQMQFLPLWPGSRLRGQWWPAQKSSPLRNGICSILFCFSHVPFWKVLNTTTSCGWNRGLKCKALAQPSVSPFCRLHYITLHVIWLMLFAKNTVD